MIVIEIVQAGYKPLYQAMRIKYRQHLSARESPEKPNRIDRLFHIAWRLFRFALFSWSFCPLIGIAPKLHQVSTLIVISALIWEI